jgi:hypothetical protein
MSLVDQWDAVEKGLDPRWSHANLSLEVSDETRRNRAAALLAPAGPGRAGTALSFSADRAGNGVGPEAIRRMVSRLDDEGIDGALELVSTEETAVADVAPTVSLAAAWDAALATIPSDWSDLFCELGLTSTDHVDHAALLLAPLNPLQLNPLQREDRRPGFRFRVARATGYGASPGMVRRCLSRLDDEGIPGDVRVLETMSDSHHVGTQGPVWYIAGKAV